MDSFIFQSIKTGIQLFINLIKKLIKSLHDNNEEFNNSKECEICDLFDVKCKVKYFQRNFKNWTSGNNTIDKFIQNAQLSSHVGHEPLEWIPYDRFYDIKYIAKGGFGIVYKANWIDGYVDEWDDERRNWKRKGQNKFVALKSLNNSKNVTLEFMNEVRFFYKL
jgi:hypothetical protein